MKLFALVFGICCIPFNNIFSFHNRAGEITYKWVGPNPYTYEIKVTIYTNLANSGGNEPPDRCDIKLNFGDGTNDPKVLRTNGVASNACTAPALSGVEIVPGLTRLNEYVIKHTYPGPGTYVITMEDPNRNANVLNMSNSSNQSFYVESMLTIPMFSGKNSSPYLSFPPIDKGCTNRCFEHNPGAYDVDGDSLSYELSYCYSSQGVTCFGYSYPGAGANGSFSIHPTKGTLTWCYPQLQGEYNIAFRIKEWRKNFDGQMQLLGSVLRDMQVTIGACNNDPPIILPIRDTCIVAGSGISKNVIASDINGDVISLISNGAPFGVKAPYATFFSNPATATVNGIFNWQTACEHIRLNPYQVTVKATDNSSAIQLVSFKTFNISVLAPPPESLTALPDGSSIKLKWYKPKCKLTTETNKILYYKIYRKTNCDVWKQAYCNTDIPISSGYQYIGYSLNINDTTYTDTNNSQGFTPGINYSYLITAFYYDGTVSYASNQVCVQLKKDVPLLLNINVNTTDNAQGSMLVRWTKPILGANGLDTSIYKGPYEFRLLAKSNASFSSYTNVYSISKQFFKAITNYADTNYTHTSINTSQLQWTYKIEFYSNGTFIGSGKIGESVYLKSISDFKKITLSWNAQTPWINSSYNIYRKMPGSIVYNQIATTTLQAFTDSMLVNNRPYCYKVQSIGAYSDPLYKNTLYNQSQEICAKPIDTIPPCAPTLTISADCEKSSINLKWNNPNKTCSDDAIKYFVYFTNTDTAPLSLLDSIKKMNDTILQFDNLKSIAGCYAISAVDSFQNESLKSKKICIENCPEFILPNIVTFNADGINDIFKAIKNKYVANLQLSIYNKWGVLVYETDNANFKWDGKMNGSNDKVSEGVYYFVCTINEIKLKGIVPRIYSGFFYVML